MTLSPVLWFLLGWRAVTCSQGHLCASFASGLSHPFELREEPQVCSWGFPSRGELGKDYVYPEMRKQRDKAGRGILCVSRLSELQTASLSSLYNTPKVKCSRW